MTNTEDTHLYYHGTSGTTWKKIKETGTLDSRDKATNWSCSDGGNYFYNAKALTNEHQDILSANQDAFCNAFDNAKIAMANDGSSHAVVLEFELTTTLTQPDTSCRNMDSAVVTYKPTPLTTCRAVYISEDIGLLTPTILASMAQCNLFQPTPRTSLQKRIIQAYAKVHICPDLESAHEVQFDRYELGNNWQQTVALMN